MTRTRKRIVYFSGLSAVVPVIFVVGWLLNLETLFSWPLWLYYVWPTALMLMPWQSGGADLWFVLAFLISLIINAVVWSALGLTVLWLTERKINN